MGRGGDSAAQLTSSRGGLLAGRRRRGVGSNSHAAGPLAPGVIPAPYPRGFKENRYLYSRFLAPELVAQLPKYTGSEEKLYGLAAGFVRNENTPALPHLGLLRTVLTDDGVGHAFCVENLPPWKPGVHHEGEKRTEHLGIGHYVYDSKAHRWYLIARHGRGIYAAHIRPYANQKTAGQRLEQILEQLGDGRYRIDEQTVTPALRRKSIDAAAAASQG